jgi:hypothetical protein
LVAEKEGKPLLRRLYDPSPQSYDRLAVVLVTISFVVVVLGLISGALVGCGGINDCHAPLWAQGEERQ